MEEEKEVVERCWICRRTEEEVRKELEPRISKEYDEDSEDAKVTLENAIDERDNEQERKEMGFRATLSNKKRVLNKRETLSLMPELPICIACENLILTIAEESALIETNDQIAEGILFDKRAKLVLRVE